MFTSTIVPSTNFRIQIGVFLFKRNSYCPPFKQFFTVCNIFRYNKELPINEQPVPIEEDLFE